MTRTPERFMVTEDHLKLARRMHVRWHHIEHGAPEIDPKRPYGNSWVENDIAEILGIEQITGDEDDEPFAPADLERMNRLHREMKDVLQIALVTGSFEPGLYEKLSWFDELSWRKVDR